MSDPEFSENNIVLPTIKRNAPGLKNPGGITLNGSGTPRTQKSRGAKLYIPRKTNLYRQKYYFFSFFLWRWRGGGGFIINIFIFIFIFFYGGASHITGGGCGGLIFFKRSGLFFIFFYGGGRTSLGEGGVGKIKK